MQGIWTVIPTIFKFGTININDMKKLIDTQIMFKIDGIVFNGTTSEVSTLSKNEKTKLVSYDISFNNKIIDDPNIDFRLGDCFNQGVIKEIQSLIQLPGKTLVLCDGGNKEKEFELYSNFLKSGDVIMLHDYAHSLEDYTRIIVEIGWQTAAESKLENIQHSINSNNLKPFHYNEFKNALWGSFIKE
jgi:cephalosporin hydroxylase